ncbi:MULTISPECIES: VacJ family lipoprotein [unclassified Modicisalibacter]|uniref:MlaA family lipoprotein n=1 Tax=unclassified Modicisalibacter TaxID=2679913 RepID=UPI001CCB29D9|nr:MULTISPECIES: VacJ family lipoprotein [unclassified Modicisalibacter]MBZ9560406.1 VacJ family lipoprotein [Modicisalibacter sp. R2A 31.J]MBZ9576315.1 VacJ family lipoprotein [Modicisalibacter sp. MOD 31.J]
MNRWSKGVLAAVAGVTLAGCASQGTAPANPQDPWEGFNRKVFAFNDTLDRYAIKPVAQGYDFVTPQPVQDGVTNFFSNLGELRTILNSGLQWKWGNAGVATGRFLMNTTLGLGGFLDPATGVGLTEHEEDFGQTLAVWGVAEGPYVVLPVLGGRTLRHAGGLPADWYADPVSHVEEDSTRYGIRALDVVNYRASVLDQEKLIQGDRYSFLRDTYLQRRRFEINDGKTGEDPFANDDFDYDAGDFAQ